MIEVFKTAVDEKTEAERLIKLLHIAWSNLTVNVDLEDCDKVLRVESSTVTIDPEELISYLALHGFAIQPLE